jgi:hypothetical protein
MHPIRPPTRCVTALLALLLLAPAALSAQTLTERLEVLTEDNARAYAGPALEGLASAMSTGLVRTADTHDILGFDVAVRASAARLPATASAFVPVLPASLEAMGRTYRDPYEIRDGREVTPTVVGAGDGVVLTPTGQLRSDMEAAGMDPSELDVAFPSGVDLPAVPFATLQGSVGLGLGTDVLFHGIPTITPHDDVGEVEAFGWGVKHRVTRWFPFPLEVAGYYGRQHLEVSEWGEAETEQYGLVASKRFGVVTLYGTGARESADLTVTYEPQGPLGTESGEGIEVGYERDGEYRFGGGLTFDLWAFRISADGHGGPEPTASAIFGLSVR